MKKVVVLLEEIDKLRRTIRDMDADLKLKNKHGRESGKTNA